MIVGVEERSLVVEAIVTLAYTKANLWTFVLSPAGVPQEIYGPLSRQVDDFTRRRLSKRQIAPLILDHLQERTNFTDIVERIVEIAANWERFELSRNEFEARATQAKAQGLLAKSRLVEAAATVRRESEKQDQDKKHIQARKQELSLLLEMFDSWAKRDDNTQERGYLLQDLLNRLFVAFEIPVHKSFTRNDGAEQIDGAFEIGGWYYLTECRWRKKLSDTREVDGLSGQISRSGRQAMGLFLSINGWSDNVPALLKQNTEKAIILMHGYDLRAVLAEEADFRDYITAAVRNLSLKAEPYLGVKDFLEQNT